MPINYKSIGQKIRKERTMHHLTLEKLAEILDLSPSYMGLIERGQRGISIETLYKLAKIFNVTTDYLLSMNDSRKTNNDNLSDEVTYQKIIEQIKQYSHKELELLLEFLQLKNKYDSIGFK
ncbi:MAG: helix-turn-helix transcriptional regulator [Thermotaleaceae bacterium]